MPIQTSTATPTSIWERIADALAALAAGEGLTEVFERLRRAPETTVAFAIAVIALGAKMAKADGQVTRNEVAAFREVFYISPEEEANAARVFDLARQDVAGFDGYARQVARMFGERKDPLIDLVEGLFHVAVADGDLHPAENEFLSTVAEIFGLPEREFRRIRAQFAPDHHPDPYDVLGVGPETPMADIRNRWRALVRDTHPDRLQARGLPEEAIRIAEKRLIVINEAWEELQEIHAL